MSECIIEGSVEVSHLEKIVDALEKHNQLVEKQNEILGELYLVLRRKL